MIAPKITGKTFGLVFLSQVVRTLPSKQRKYFSSSFMRQISGFALRPDLMGILYQ